MKPSYLLRWMQEYASEHASEMGLGWQELMQEDMVYLLSRMTVKISRMPKAKEDIEIKTWEREASKVLYNREFSIRSREGKALVEATTQWMLVNPKTRRIIRPDKAGFATPKQEFTAQVEDRGRIRLPETMEWVGRKVIRYSDIDRNGHVNNAVYADILCDFCGMDLSLQPVTEIYLSFVHEALPGQVIDLYTVRENKRVLMEGRVEYRVCFEGILEVKECERK